MKITVSIICLLALFTLVTSCHKIDNAKLDQMLNSDELYIQKNTYGGIAGYYEQHFHLKKGDYEALLIIDEGTDYQTFIRMEKKKELLRMFLREAFASNDPNKSMSNSCVTGVDHEYIIKNNWTSLILRPNEKSDSIFNLILHTRE